MKTAADVLKSKAHQAVHTITPGALVFDALKLMADKNIGALLVMEGERIAGIITERDYARKIVLMSRSSRETPVREIMTSAVMYVRPGQTTEECMVLIDREQAAPPARGGRQQVAGARFHRRLGEEHHLGAEVHDRATPELHLRIATLIGHFPSNFSTESAICCHW